MREIKYKAWDIKTKKMREIHSISFHNKRDVFHYNDSNTPKVINLWGYDIIEQKDIVLHRESNEVILLEYTGLKDKNGKGKEIYKGDIVEFNNCDYMRTAGHLADEIERGIIVFEDGAFWVNDRLLIDVLTNDEEAKVIGNIYEDKHLLGSEDK